MARQRKAAPTARLSRPASPRSRPSSRTRTTASTTCSTATTTTSSRAARRRPWPRLQGRDRPIYHNDHSRPERPVIRTLDDEIGRVVRARVVNPKWIDGRQAPRLQGRLRDRRHGRLPLRFRRHHRRRPKTTTSTWCTPPFSKTQRPATSSPTPMPRRCRISPTACNEAIDRGLWTPKSNSARTLLDRLRRPAETLQPRPAPSGPATRRNLSPRSCRTAPCAAATRIRRSATSPVASPAHPRPGSSAAP